MTTAGHSGTLVRVDDLLAAIESYCDAVPRTAARAEQIGPFTLFVNPGPGWRYYARPGLGASGFSAADVQRVRARQLELGIPEAFEWVAETTPRLRTAAEVAGLDVAGHPLMALGGDARPPVPTVDGVEFRLVTAEDDVALAGAVARMAFTTPGTAVGPTSIAEAVAFAAERDPAEVGFERERLRTGRTVTAVALIDGRAVASGSHQPVGAVSEVAGVGVLPAFRRRGIAAALTGYLVNDARRRDVRTIFLSAGDGTIARVYEHAGFRRVGTACTAEPATPAEGT